MSANFHDDLGRELLRVGLQQQRRRRRRIRTAVASFMAAAVGSLTLLWPNPANADVEVRFEDGRVVVRITNSGASPDEVVDALQDAGLDASAEGRTTGPSSVGRFLSAAVAGGGDQPVVLDPAPVGTAFRTFSVPEDFAGKLTIGVGVPSKGSGRYEIPSDAFAPGEPLRCRGVLGARLRDAAGELHELDVSVRMFREGLFLGEMPLAEALGSDAASWFVEVGHATGTESVSLHVVERTDARESGC